MRASMDIEEFRELVTRCIEGTASEEEQERVVGAAESSPELSSYLERTVHIDAALKARQHEGSVFARMVVDRLSHANGSGRFRSAVMKELRDGRVLDARRNVRGRRLFLMAAVAAAVALLIGVGAAIHLGRRSGKRGVPGAALGKLVAGAERARNVDDLRALNTVARRAYEDELARGGGCDPVTLVDLGLAMGITGNPKEDRQAEDLRFLAGNAARAGENRLARDRAWSLPGLMSIAEAAGAGPTPEEVREIRKKYAEARAHVDRKFYHGWAKALTDLYHNTVEPRGWRRMLDAIRFEHVYIIFYEQGFDCTLKDTADAVWHKGLAHRDYFDAKLKPVFDEAARFRRALEANIDFGKKGISGDGGWSVHQFYRREDVVLDMDFYTVLQGFRDCKGTTLRLGKPSFEEAVLTGRLHVSAVSPGYEREMRGMWEVFFENGKRATRATVERRKELHFTEDTWFWFLAHFSHAGGGEWKMKSWIWRDGSQPPGIRRLLPDDPVLAGRENLSMTAKDPGYRGPGGIAFSASRAKLEWQAIALRILRPARGGGREKP